MLAQHRQQAGLRVNVNRITMPINRETNRRHFEAPFEECVRRFRQKILPRMIPPRGPQILSVVIPQRERESLPFVIPTRGLIARGICFSPPSNPPPPFAPRSPTPYNRACDADATRRTDSKIPHGSRRPRSPPHVRPDRYHAASPGRILLRTRAATRSHRPQIRNGSRAVRPDAILRS